MVLTISRKSKSERRTLRFFGKKLPVWTLIALLIAAGAAATAGPILKDTIKGFKSIIDGEYDHLPEQAFYMIGSIEEAEERAKAL